MCPCTLSTWPGMGWRMLAALLLPRHCIRIWDCRSALTLPFCIAARGKTCEALVQVFKLEPAGACSAQPTQAGMGETNSYIRRQYRQYSSSDYCFRARAYTLIYYLLHNPLSTHSTPQPCMCTPCRLCASIVNWMLLVDRSWT